MKTVVVLLVGLMANWVGGSATVVQAESSLRFRETSADWGIDFRHHHGGTGDFYMIETMGSGVVAFDYDNDGDPDLLFVDSGPVPGYTGPAPRTRLFRNDGVGATGHPTFVDATDASGINVTAYGMGATAGDVDGDGDLDLYVTAFGANQLFRNRGDGSFEDATAEAGVGDTRWGASAAFGDVDGDGDLDLYVTNYLDFSYANNPICGVKARGIRSYCHPDIYEGVPDVLYRNRGDGTFDDVSVAAGIAVAADGTPRLGKGLGVVISDLDGDDRSDIYVANDMVANFQFQNESTGAEPRFDELALLTGTAVSDLGVEEAGMGVGIGDLDGNGHLDLFVTHLDLQTNALYSNGGGGVFADRRFASKLAESSLYRVGFGADFADFDHDGDLDLMVANGHIIHNVEEWGTGTTYKQANQVFANRGDGTFVGVPDAGLAPVRASRGLATADLDGDGDLDVAISNSNDVAEVYENATPSRGRWVQLDFRGAGGRPGSGIGIRVTARTAGDRAFVREVRTASSYLSQNDLTLHLGLGNAEQLEVTLRGAPGRTRTLRGLPVDIRVMVSWGRSAARRAAPPPKP